MSEKILELIGYLLPSIVTGAIAYLFFKDHTKFYERIKKLEFLQEQQKDFLPTKLQAFERMTLFLERIKPAQLLVRVKPIGSDKTNYVNQLRTVINSEFEHNLTQQIYISSKCWNVIVTSKNATMHIIAKLATDENIKDAQQLREAVLERMVQTEPPSNTALAFIKSEIEELF